MTVLRSLVYNLLFYGLTLVAAALLLPCLFLPRSAARHVAAAWTWCSLMLARALCGVCWEVKGRENIRTGATIYASKHQSAWETLAFWVILREPLYVLKQELLWLPLVGWYLRKVGNIAINRGAGASAMKGMITRCKTALAAGETIVIFPEGTRTRPQETRPFNPGIAALYAQAGTPVIPVALNSGLCWKRNSFMKKPGLITVEFLPAIAPGIPPREFLALLEKTINEATQRIGG